MNGPLYTINPLFDFQALCDTDYGLYKLIKQDYYDRDIFDNNLFDSTDDRYIRTILLCRQYFNPLFIFCKKGAMKQEEMDNLYKEFLDKEYDRILELSTPTAIMDIASVSNNVNNLVNVTILCETEKEQEWILKNDNKLNCTVSDYNNFNLSKFDAIYIKDIYTLLKFDQNTLKNKHIMFPRFIFNLELGSRNTEIPIIEVSQKYYKENKFAILDPYKDITIPVSEMV